MDDYAGVPSTRLTQPILTEMRRRAFGVRVDADPITRFLAKCVRDEVTGCVVWLACLDGSGYGEFAIGRTPMAAHRFAYEQFVGPIHADLVIDHLCRNRSCVNVEHMRAVTRRDNNLAPGSLSPSKINADKRQCNNGHAFDSQNTHVLPDGKRRCKTCNQQAVRRYKSRKRVE